ncbi:MAG: class I lanthipeptide [Acidobacteria bacterium]|jgi:hypothetical protein|nr:class I lanthipeptide [Acidobacteriota bacterium]
MKKKTTEKRLQFNKTTVYNLDALVMQSAKGGTGETYDKLCAINSEGTVCTHWTPVCEGTYYC